METLDSKCEFPLDQLPILIIEKIAWYLSNKDLANCCAVSRGVREAFDIELVWKPRYDSDRVKYLLETPCKVHPIFENPEKTKTDLSTISQSRLAFMAENHLWNNWRQGKYTKEILWRLPTSHHFIYGYRPIYNRFITNDYVASIFSDRIEIVDVRNSPATRAFKPIPVTIFMHSSVRIVVGKIIVLFRSSVKVFHLNVSTKQWVLKHSFFIDETEILPDDRLLHADLDFFKCRPTCTFTLIDHFIVGVAEDGAIIHIWNFEIGIKIKKELLPVENAEIQQMLATTSKDLILSVQHGENYDSSLLLAYSLPKLKFLPFRQEVQGTFIDPYDYRIFGNYISVWGDGKLSIHDYQNRQVKLVDHPIKNDVLPQPLGNSIVFLEGENLKLFDPFTSKMQTLEYGVTDFVVLFGKFIQVQGWEFPYDLLEIDNHCKVSRKVSYPLMFGGAGSDLFVNKPNTKFITDTLIWNFW